MSLDTSFLAESRCQPHVTALMLDRLGSDQFEDFCRRAIDYSLRTNRPELASRSQAWLMFSTHTRMFDYYIATAQKRAQECRIWAATLRGQLEREGLLPAVEAARDKST